jgi:hypothetical protein
MHKFMITAFAITLASVWAVGPALAQDTMKDKAERTKDKLQDKGERAKDKIEGKTESTMDKVNDKTREVKDKVKDKAIDAKDWVKDKTSDAKDKMGAKKDRLDAKMDRAGTKNAQQALRQRGFDPGPIDGVHGPLTTAAVRNFQKAENLTVTGQLDDATKEKLNMASSKVETAPSASPATAPAPEKRQSP